ncbi:RHS repeat-associated core domain-containing protein, partial [Pseudodesulfovibrio sp.]|uniref:RHS repeat-associated core domain-containing protein n=1 Tax=Pseudodesulfovibrio sp. TaxID=2035812 RepID=UPI00262B5EE0
MEAYRWLDLLRLDGFHDGESGYRFAYRDGERTPYAMRRDDGAVAYLLYDQVGSLRVVADRDGDVIKEVLYDPFGGIIEDTNPGLRIPIGFAGGLHDRDLGFVRFGWRDYDTFTDRWIAPDPLGDKGGDPDWYGYCLDDPVNG